MKVLIQSQQARFRKGLGLAQTSRAGGNRGLAEAPLCRKGRYALPVHMIKLTKEREIAPYVWVHPDDEPGSRSVYHPILALNMSR
jgi:hypothetical protein